jgi:alpha-tubulin suppressor-like RCC1 family protein
MTEPAFGAEEFPPAPAPPEHWPRELDADYELVSELGRGGMAVVFRARDRELGRDVAIKVVKPRFAADEEAVGRLAREARTVAQLEHPNIVGVYAIRHLAERSVALIMQIVPGRTLKAELANGPLDPARAEHILRDIGRALAYAHKAGVVHRDVKPENIFLDEVSGRALLSDFGVARVLDAPAELTATGTTIGTPTYMAPEQIDGVQLDGRSDLYALGMVAWEMLTGQRPWAGESLYNVIYRQKHDQLPPLDFYRNDVPPRLQYLIEGLLHKNPDRRWSSAARFLALLSSDQPLPGLREWQAAARRRRRTLTYQQSRSRGDSVLNAAVETVRFDREEAARAVGARRPEVAMPPPVEMPSAITELRSPAPAGHLVIEPEERDPRRALLFTAAGFAVAVGALSLWLSMGRAPDVTATPTAPTALADRPVQVPVLPAAPTAAPTDSTRDSTGLGAVDSSASMAPLPNVATRANDKVTAAADSQVSRNSASGETSRRPSPALAESPGTVASVNSRRDAPNAVVQRPAASRAAASSASPALPPPLTVSIPPTPVVTTPTLSFPTERAIMAAGGRHSCLIVEAGRPLCWGNNDAGQLGDGTFDGRATPASIDGEFSFTQLAAGSWHSCGLTSSGEAFCWGKNEAGQLGDATTAARAAPVRVNSSTTFRLLRAGASHTCGLSRAGAVLCWGANNFGQLGDGSRSAHASPVAVSLPAPAVALATGSNHTCALTGDGVAYCWGQNRASQIGDGSSTDRSAPTQVVTDARFVSIAAGQQHTCGVAPNGNAYCWGANGSGQLGTGVPGGSSWPQQVDASVGFTTIVAGYSHTCARSRDGRAWCWGQNAHGQLGDGSTTTRTRPVAVSGLSSLVTLQAGAAHTCGVTSSGEAFCWGYNIEGQLGGGDRENASTPSRIVLPR